MNDDMLIESKCVVAVNYLGKNEF